MSKRSAFPGLWCLLFALASVGCAREEMPPGTGPDFDPPRVSEMFPAEGSAVPDMDGEAYVEFDEPLADPRSVERVIEASPVWRYEVKAGRRSVRIRPRDGWRPGVVYTFRIPPGLRDLVRNQTREPIVLQFTTGARFYDTRISGIAWDRESVQPARDVSILVTTPDSVPYAAVTDTAGAFGLAGLSAGDYWAFGYRDQNRNQVLDRGFEPYDSARVELADSTSAVDVDLWLTPPDSTPPILTGAEAADSLTVRLEFDDLLDPDAPRDSAYVRITTRPGGEMWPVREFVFGTPASGDSEVPETSSSDSIPGRRENAAREEPEAPPVAAPDSAVGLQEETVLPARPERTLTVRLTNPLAPGEYDVSARGFVNLRQLAGGGDTLFVYEVPPAPEEETGEPIPGSPDDAARRGVEESGGEGT